MADLAVGGLHRNFFNNGTCNDTGDGCDCPVGYLPPFCRYRDCEHIMSTFILYIVMYSTSFNCMHIFIAR